MATITTHVSRLGPQVEIQRGRIRLIAVIGDDAAGPLLLDQLAQDLPEEGHIGDPHLSSLPSDRLSVIVLSCTVKFYLLLLEQLDHLTVTEFSRVVGMGDILHGEKKHQDHSAP